MLKRTAATALPPSEHIADRLSRSGLGDQLNNLGCDALCGCRCRAHPHTFPGQRAGHKYGPVSGLIIQRKAGGADPVTSGACPLYLQLNLRRVTRQPDAVMRAFCPAVLSAKSSHHRCPAGSCSAVLSGSAEAAAEPDNSAFNIYLNQAFLIS